MSGNVQHYFIPYVREGIAVKANGNNGKRQLVEVNLSVRSGSDNLPVSQDVAIYGPGDVLGFNKSIVAGTTPAHNDNGFRADLIPYIEFNEPDFLWRYSQTKVDSKYWLPWLSLIVLKPGEDFELANNANPKLPPLIELKENAVLPDLSAMWRWAHVHLNEEAGLGAKMVRHILKHSPHKAVCRLMCPKRLETQTRYTAFVVPTYKLGLEAALGRKLNASLGDLSWQGNTTIEKQLPYYFSWGFETGEQGDFETLANLLSGVPINERPDDDTRMIDASHPGYDIQLAGYSLNLEGALKYPSDSVEVEESPIESSSLEQVLNYRFNDEGRPIVGPPIYGAWYKLSGEATTAVSTGSKKWKDELNLDFQHRIAAGLGVQFVKENQEQLMESAWIQLEEAKKANQALNLGRFGRAISDRMHKRVFGSTDIKEAASPTLFQFQMGLAMQTRLVGVNNESHKTQRRTLADQLQESPISYHAKQLKTQRYIRKNRPLAQKVEINKRVLAMDRRTQLATTFRMNGLVKAPPVSGPPRFLHIISGQITAILDSQANTIREGMKLSPIIEQRLQSKIQAFLEWESVSNPYTSSPITTAQKKSGGIAAAPDVLRDIVWYPEFHTPLYRYLKERFSRWLAPSIDKVPNNTISFLETNRKFIESFMIGANHEFASELRWREFPTDMKGSYFRKFWDTTIYSVDDDEKLLFRTTLVATELVEELQEAGLVNAGDSVETILVSVEEYYDQPGPLTDEQKNLMLAYEEAVERWLLTRNEDKDIKHPINWTEKSELGGHGISNTNGASMSEIVILIKGDLLRKFPNTLVYLAEKTAGVSIDDSLKFFPIFEGQLTSDALFLGFPVPTNQASSHWLVFEEPMSDIRYGLDVIQPNEVGEYPSDEILQVYDPSDTAWRHFNVSEGEFLDNVAPINLVDSWSNPSYIASIFVQHPVRIKVPMADFFT